MKIRDLSPDQVAKIIRQYLNDIEPATRARVIPLIKEVISEYEDDK